MSILYFEGKLQRRAKRMAARAVQCNREHAGKIRLHVQYLGPAVTGTLAYIGAAGNLFTSLVTCALLQTRCIHLG